MNFCLCRFFCFFFSCQFCFLEDLLPCPCCPWFPCFFCWFLGACLLDEESFLDWSESSFRSPDDCLESEASGGSSPAWGLGFSPPGSEPSVLKKSWASPEEPDASGSLGCWSSTGASLVSASLSRLPCSRFS